MPDVPINVRCSNGEKFSTEVELNVTILGFKQKISEKAGVPPEQQRLIYKGRVMKEDNETLANYTVEAGSTVHLVRSQARSAPAPAAASPGATNPSPFGNPGTGGYPPGSGMGAGNPFAGMMGNMGGGMDINRMQQQLMSNPEMMANIMNSPMMEALLNNPETLRSIMFSNPQMQQVMQNNPQLAQVLNDPATMRQYLEMARNPAAMEQARRSQDLMMSQIENQPGGFNALRRIYAEVQEPMMQASEGLTNNESAGSAGSNTPAPAASNPSGGPNTSALPNPWAPAGTQRPVQGPGSNASSPSSNAGAGAGFGASNPWATLAAGLPQGAAGPGGAQFDPAMMQNLMNDPMVQQMVNQMADDPALMESMIAQNPHLQQALQANPALREQLPLFMRRMTDPQNVQALAQMQQSMQQLQRAGLFPGMPGAGGGADFGAGMAGLGGFGNLNLGGTPPTPPGGLDFSALLGGASMGAGAGTTGANPWGNMPSSASSPTASSGSSNSPAEPSPRTIPAPVTTPTPPSMANPEETYAPQLAQMNDMGFTDRAACVRALVASQGNVNAAVERMLGGGV